MINDVPQPLVDHLLELRRRLMKAFFAFGCAFILCYWFSEDIFRFLVQPLADLLHQKGDRRLIYTGVAEAFLTYIKVAAFSAFFLAFPFIAAQAWLFIAPGLYQREKKVFMGLMVATPVLFFLGAGFAYVYVFPAAYEFFLSFEAPALNGGLPIQLEAKVNEYLSFVMRIVLGFGICFEMPVLLTLLANMGMITSQGLIARWRIAVVGMAALAAFVTPPDVFSMVGLTIPLVLLYGISILLVRMIEKRRLKKEKDPCLI